MGFQFRAAQPDDAPAIRRVAIESWYVTYKNIFSPDFIAQFLERNYSVDALTRAIGQADHIFEVATTEKGEVVGFSQYGDLGDGPQLLRIYVRSHYFRRGIGGEFIRRLEDQLSARGIFKYHCYVHGRNEIGKNFYLKHGFVHVTARNKEDEWCMEKALSAMTSSPARS